MNPDAADAGDAAHAAEAAPEWAAGPDRDLDGADDPVWLRSLADAIGEPEEPEEPEDPEPDGPRQTELDAGPQPPATA